ncbi:TVP38/TMEM64 family membrane protein [Porphyridium purpureum]|uniref:TVP38/TMEM64 family membrane protein n=1 Tax=Porphyridium purpureum TaxID=35688 RepID=A0A5J4Z188_PORPP|nr:TVP38/TMEM64 family membrane protein [Porphyridium purpureum]|eukprot:POR7553..scf295_1
MGADVQVQRHAGGVKYVEMRGLLDWAAGGDGAQDLSCAMEARAEGDAAFLGGSGRKVAAAAGGAAPGMKAGLTPEAETMADVQQIEFGSDLMLNTGVANGAAVNASAAEARRAQELVPIVVNQAAPLDPETPRQRRHWFSEMRSALFANRLLVLVATLLLVEPLVVVVMFKSLSVEQLQHGVAWLTSLHPLYGMGLYLVAFAVLVVLGTPSSPLTIASGFLFGTIHGLIVAMLGSAAAASASFLGSRYFGSHDAIRAWVERSFSPQRVRAFDLSIYRDAFRFVFFVRLSPAFPFGLSNYMFAVTSVPYMTFLFASMLGILPGTIILAVTGSLADDVFFSDSAAATNPFWSGVRTVLIVVGLLSSVLVISIISQATEKDVEESLDELEEPA